MLKNQSINFKHSKLNFAIDPNNANPYLLKLFLRFPSDEALPGGSHVARLNFKTSRVGGYKFLLLIVGRGRLSLVAISFYALSLLFGPCRLLEFTLAGPLYCMGFELNTIEVKKIPKPQELPRSEMGFI